MTSYIIERTQRVLHIYIIYYIYKVRVHAVQSINDSGGSKITKILSETFERAYKKLYILITRGKYSYDTGIHTKIGPLASFAPFIVMFIYKTFNVFKNKVNFNATAKSTENK